MLIAIWVNFKFLMFNGESPLVNRLQRQTTWHYSTMTLARFSFVSHYPCVKSQQNVVVCSTDSQSFLWFIPFFILSLWMHCPKDLVIYPKLALLPILHLLTPHFCFIPFYNKIEQIFMKAHLQNVEISPINEIQQSKGYQ